MLFNNWGSSPERLTEHWISYRLGLFMNYTLKSLMLQTSQDFSCYALYDPKSEAVVHKILDLFPPLPANIRFVTPVLYKSLLKSELRDTSRMYRVYLSSDDMYHKDFIKKLHLYKPQRETVALIPQYGYAYDSVRGRLGAFFFWLPSYGATILNADDYLKGQAPRHTWRDALKISREFININEPVWINHIHGQNTATTFENMLGWKDSKVENALLLEPWTDANRSRACFGPEVTDPDEIKRILSQFY
jgi:hypothetical protein